MTAILLEKHKPIRPLIRAKRHYKKKEPKGEPRYRLRNGKFVRLTDQEILHRKKGPKKYIKKARFKKVKKAKTLIRKPSSLKAEIEKRIHIKV